MFAYHVKWLPTLSVTDESLAQALFIENDNREQLQIAVNNGICRVLNNSE
ncbi:MAG: hypothetical protein HRU22_13525 [Gammaproteobacteria bacterium]|nr:hypothetical protein [Gammaproteobacteria bacterium]